MKTPSIVRAATLDDRAEIWRLLMLGFRENGMFSLSPQKVEAFIFRALHPEQIHPADTGPRAKIAVVGSPGRLEALCFVLLSAFWYSDEIHLEELIVYVDPECRKSNHAKELIAWMKKTADQLDVKLLTGIISTERTEGKIRFYDRYLPRVGAFYLYPITDPELKRKNFMEKDSWVASNRL